MAGIMDGLPEEIILHILSFLEPQDVASVQLLCRRLCSIGRDAELWKARCFENSQYEALRRRQQALSDQEARLTDLRHAIDQSMSPASTSDSSPGTLDSRTRRQRAYSNWDPSYPTERVNFYEEYIHRHAPISLRYFEMAKDGHNGSEVERESLGIGLFKDPLQGLAERLVAPLDDGSVCIWDASLNSQSRGKIVARSRPGLLNGSSTRPKSPAQQALSAETGAVDTVSVDSQQHRAFIAGENHLHEIDLNTLAVVRRQTFPFHISALSEAKGATPLTVGSNMTLHLYDPRVSLPHLGVGSSFRSELIAGGPTTNGSPAARVSSEHVSLSQPGPLSILHFPRTAQSDDPSHSIWVAGRFTSLLHYDRRFWPRITGTTFSGARISALSLLPYPFINPRQKSMSLHPNIMRNAKSGPGMTVIAAGQYKGKGSLELYSAGDSEERTEPDSPPLLLNESRPAPSHHHLRQYQNRQYASKSRLLSVAPHGARIVFSDGDGVLKWVERDAWSVVRSFNINDVPQPFSSPTSNNNNITAPPPSSSNQHSLFASQPSDDPNSDIVQKIVPLSAGNAGGDDPGEVNGNDLAIWTGDGKLGLVGFGKNSLRPVWGDGSGDGSATGDESDHDDEARMEQRRERAYARRMREALEGQANQTRILRGLGMGV